MYKPEILAPAGTKEAFIGAINAGADAIYLAGKRFGARAYANNFDDEALVDAINYAHLRGVLVFIAINTIIFDDEIEDLLSYTDFLAKHHVDAFIVQDLGVIKLLAHRYPDVEIHASTQMNTHSIDQAMWLKHMGVKRIVLARETSLETIKKIKKHVDIDLEVFVHGALCVCYSGQCLMSSMIGGRSGNRGECAQPCRLAYSLYKNQTKISDQSYLLSTKDLMTIDHLDELINAGIHSFKIEGRMRKKEYVIEAVKDYRMALDHFIDRKVFNLEKSITDLKKVFNRDFTKGLILDEKPRDLNHSLRPNHMGIPVGKVIGYQKNKAVILLENTLNINDGYRILGEPDYGDSVSRLLNKGKIVTQGCKGDVITLDVTQGIAIGSLVLKTLDFEHETSLASYMDENYKLIALEGQLEAFVKQPLRLSITDGTHQINLIGEHMIEKAERNPILHHQYVDQLSKLGQTPFYFKKLDILTDELGFVPIKWLNELRRSAIEKMITKKTFRENSHIVPVNFKKLTLEKNQTPWSIHVQTKAQYETAKMMGYQEIVHENILEIDDACAIIKTKRIQMRMHEPIFGPTMIQDVGHLKNAKNHDIYTDQYFNVSNIYAVHLLHEQGVKRVTLSPEISFERIKKMIPQFIKEFGYHPHLELQIYGRHDLMITKYCPIAKTFKTDQDCHLCEKNQYYLEDRLGSKYPLIHDGNCNLRILHSKTLNLLSYAKELIDLGITCRLNFTTEDAYEMKEVLLSASHHKTYPFHAKSMTKGRFIT